jgi:hypothetical protein
MVLRGFGRVQINNYLICNDLRLFLSRCVQFVFCSAVESCARLTLMRFEKIWVKQCKATKGIKRRFGAKSALDYLVGEKLMMFADEAEGRPAFAAELPRFLAATWQVFNQYEIAGYVASQKPAARKRLRELLYLR